METKNVVSQSMIDFLRREYHMHQSPDGTWIGDCTTWMEADLAYQMKGKQSEYAKRRLARPAPSTTKLATVLQFPNVGRYKV